MDQTTKQAIDDLFARVRQAEVKLGDRDPEAEAAIGAHLARFPAASYYLAQAVLAQEDALARIHLRLRAYEERTVSGDLLAALTGAAAAKPSAPDPVRSAGPDTPFLGTAPRTAVGIAAGLAVAELLGETLGTAMPDETDAIDDAFGMAEPESDTDPADVY